MSDRGYVRKLLSGTAAIGIYLCVVLTLIYYFNTKSRTKRVNYVEKNTPHIRIDLATSDTSSSKKMSPVKKPKKRKNRITKKEKRKIEKKRKVVSKTSKKVKKTSKKARKKTAVAKDTKKERKKMRKPKRKEKPKALFSAIKTTDSAKKSSRKQHTVSSKRLFEKVDAPNKKRISKGKEKTHRTKGVENAYLAKIQRLLEQWPAQSDFAGEKVKVLLKIRPDGFFDFTLVRRSANPAFNKALSDYLKQLQRFGFGPHKGGRTYIFEAEFIAKE